MHFSTCKPKAHLAQPAIRTKKVVSLENNATKQSCSNFSSILKLLDSYSHWQKNIPTPGPFPSKFYKAKYWLHFWGFAARIPTGASSPPFATTFLVKFNS